MEKCKWYGMNYTCNKVDYEGSILDTSVPVKVEETVTSWRLVRSFTHCPKVPSMDEIITFSDLIQSLDTWEALLFDELEWLLDMDEVVDYIDQDGIMIASDGSVEGCNTSFGWVISTLAGSRLVCCSGYAFGVKESGSFCAEGYGMLAVLRFLYHFQQFSEYAIDQEIPLYMDSQSLLDQLQEVQLWEHTYPNGSMSTDWDVVQTIVETLEGLPNSIQPKWV